MVFSLRLSTELDPPREHDIGFASVNLGVSFAECRRLTLRILRSHSGATKTCQIDLEQAVQCGGSSPVGGVIPWWSDTTVWAVINHKLLLDTGTPGTLPITHFNPLAPRGAKIEWYFEIGLDLELCANWMDVNRFALH